MLTLIIAIIGAITGILALIIQFVEYRKSKVKLKVCLDIKKSFYTSGDNTYKCKYFGVLSVKISNCSSLPITIDEAEIECDNNVCKYFNENKKINNRHVYDKHSFTEIELYEQAKLPIRIECYDTIFLSFIFPFFDEFINKKFNYILKTPRKDYKFKFKLNNFESLFKNKEREE